MNNTDSFYQEILNEIGGADESFTPMACYNADGDCVEFHLSNDNYFAKRLDGWVTIYLSESNDNNVVGGMIKGVKSNLLKRFPGIKFEFKEEGQVDLSVLLKATSYEADINVKHQTYTDILYKTKELVVGDLELV